MKNIILILSIFLLVPKVQCQENLDSLWSLWKNDKLNDTIRINAVSTVAQSLSYNDPDSSAVISIALYDFCTDVGYPKGQAVALNLIAITHYFKGNSQEALKKWHEASTIYEDIKDVSGQASIIGNMGSIYFRLGHMNKAKEYFLKSLALYEEIGYKLGQANLVGNLGIIYKHEGDMDKALEYYHKSLALHIENKNLKGQADVIGNIGIIYHTLEKYEQAIENYRKANVLNQQVHDKIGASMNFVNLGTTFNAIGRHDSAEVYCEQALQLAVEASALSQQKEACSCLSKAYEKQNKLLKALNIFKQFVTISDSLNDVESNKEILEMEAQYEYDKQKAIDDKEHEKQLAIKQQEKEKQRIIIWAALFGLLLMVAFVIVIFNRLRITRSQKEIIEEVHQEIKDSIIYAKRIQTAILPPNKVVNEYLPDSVIFYKPKDVVAGDFYWIEKINDLVLFAAADCTGHGVPGAMVSVVCHNAMNRAVREFNLKEPAKILDKTRELIISEFEKSEENVQDGMDIALCTLKGNTMQYSGANNPLWIIREKTQEEIETQTHSNLVVSSNNKFELIEVKADRQPIGKFIEPKPFANHTIELQRGDCIYVFTDGFADQFGGTENKKFGTKKLRELLLSIADKSMTEQNEILKNTIEDWQGSVEQLDDICILGVQI